MPRYIVERSFPDGLNIPVNDDGAGICGGVVARNAENRVTWIQSFVSSDRKQTFCLYDAPVARRDSASCTEEPVAGRQDHRSPRSRPLFYH